jgi:hypothetical protein
MGKEEDLINAIVERSEEAEGKKQLSCAEAFKIARELGVEIREVGCICNREKIRIRNCQLGCFK